MSLTCHEAFPRFQLMPDEDVVVYARAGHDRATEYLMAKYRHLVECKARCYFLAGADHEDVVQEGMIGLYKAIRDFRDDRLARFRGFAELCVTRQIISAVKSATRQKHVPLNGYVSLSRPSGDSDAGASLLECIADERAPDPVAFLLDWRDRCAIEDTLRDALSDLESRVLENYLEGRSYREMSGTLHCRTKCIDNALQRVKRKICVLFPSEAH